MSNNDLSIVVAGDISLGGEYDRLRRRRGLRWDYPFKDITWAFKSADLRFANLECCLLRNEKKRPKDWLLWADPESTASIESIGVDVVSLANNHIGDLGNEGVAATLSKLHEVGIRSVGSGMDGEAASQWSYIDVKNYKCAFGAYCDTNIPATTVAGNGVAGCNPVDEPSMLRDIAKAREQADIVCVSIHWGEQLYDYPAPHQVRLGRAMVDAGANVILGHHPHVVQGYEKYRNGAIFYSLGNFFLTDFRLQSGVLYKYPSISNRFLIARIEFSAHKHLEIYPIMGVIGKNYKLSIPQGEKQKDMLNSLNELCKPLGGKDYCDFWDTYLPHANRRVELDWKRHKRRAMLHLIRQRGFSGILSALSKRVVSRLR